MENKIIEYSKKTKDGYRLLVIFQPMGHRCGYVGLPKDHVANNIESYIPCVYFEDLDEWTINKIIIQKNINNIKVHGGLTYANSDKEIFKNNRWYFGFDCIHGGDAVDYESAFKYFKDNPEVIKKLKQNQDLDNKFPINDNVVRDLDYVKKEVKSLYKQLKAIAKG